MIRFAAAAAVLAVLVAASLVWAGETPTERPTADAAKFVKGSITTRAIRNRTIRLRDLRPPLRRLVRRAGPSGEDGEDGLDGLDGQDGFDGLDGQDGQDGVSGYEVVRMAFDETAGVETEQVDCPSGKVVVGGGATPAPGASGTFDVQMSAPQDDNSGWQATVQGPSGNWQLMVQAICVTALP
jgi:hypothetical protein